MQILVARRIAKEKRDADRAKAKAERAKAKAAMKGLSGAERDAARKQMKEDADKKRQEQALDRQAGEDFASTTVFLTSLPCPMGNIVKDVLGAMPTTRKIVPKSILSLSPATPPSNTSSL